MKLDVLAIGAHPDDVEISAGGTMLKLNKDGYKTGILDLTGGELGTRGTKETRFHEASEASKLMGLSARENLGLKDGFFNNDEFSILKIIEIIRKYRPKTLLLPAISDRHPDHGRASELTSRAAFLSGLLKIETTHEGIIQEPWRASRVYHYIQDYYHQPNFVMDISDLMDKKIEVIQAYKTQFFDPNSKDPETPISGKDFFDFLKSRSMQFGRPSGIKYAEGFTTERPIAVNDITKLF